MMYALNDPRASLVFILYYYIEMYVKMCNSCTNKDIIIKNSYNVISSSIVKINQINTNFIPTCKQL